MEITLGYSTNVYKRFLFPYIPKRTLRSADKILLTVPRTVSSYGDRGFYAAAPKLWNALPLELRSCSSINVFKKTLKTNVCETAYNIVLILQNILL